MITYMMGPSLEDVGKRSITHVFPSFFPTFLTSGALGSSGTAHRKQSINHEHKTPE